MMLKLIVPCCALALQATIFAPVAHAADTRPLMSCKPAAERTQAEGCWIIASQALGDLSGKAVYWTLDTYPSVEFAEKAKGHHSVVAQALDKTWLFTIGRPPALTSKGHRIRQIGPLPIKQGETYTAQFMEGILQPGTVSRTHVHAGPEAFYTETGESCLETPAGRQVGRLGVDVVIPEGTPMELVASGSETRRGIVLVLHSSSKAPTTVISDWKSKGLCNTDAPDPSGVAGLQPWESKGQGVAKMPLAGGLSATDMTTFRMFYPATLTVDRTPHYHLGTEHVIVLKGIIHLGLGSCLEPDKAVAYGPGSFMAIPAGTPHFEWFEGEVLIQVTSIGPMKAVQIADGCKEIKTT